MFCVLIVKIHADEQKQVTEISKLGDVEHIKSIPLYANLIESGLKPDGQDGQYSMTGDGIPALPVGLDFQLLSINGGRYHVKLGNTL